MVNRLFFYAATAELGLNLSAEVYTQVAPNGRTYLRGCLQRLPTSVYLRLMKAWRSRRTYAE